MKFCIILILFIGVCNLNALPNTWTGAGGDNLWSNPSNWTSGVPSAVDTVVINGALSGVIVSGNKSIARLEISNSILNTTASWSISDSIFIDVLSTVNWNASPWAEGVYVNYGVINFNVPSGTVLFLNARLHNYGVFNHMVGNIAFWGTAINEESGVFNILCENCLLNGTSNLTSEFFDNGQIKRNGSGAARISVKYTGNGLLTIENGELVFKNGQTVFEEEIVEIAELGTLLFEAGKINGRIAGENLGSFIIQNFNVAGKSELNVSDNGVRWEFSNWSGVDTLTNNGILSYTSTTDNMLLAGLTLENNGIFNLKPDSFLDLLSIQGELLNNGVIDIQNDCAIGGSGTFLNRGSIIKSGGNGKSSINMTLPESGNIQVQIGTLKI